jgi:hypothetical protein
MKLSSSVMLNSPVIPRLIIVSSITRSHGFVSRSLHVELSRDADDSNSLIANYGHKVHSIIK